MWNTNPNLLTFASACTASLPSACSTSTSARIKLRALPEVILLATVIAHKTTTTPRKKGNTSNSKHYSYRHSSMAFFQNTHRNWPFPKNEDTKTVPSSKKSHVPDQYACRGSSMDARDFRWASTPSPLSVSMNQTASGIRGSCIGSSFGPPPKGGSANDRPSPKKSKEAKKWPRWRLAPVTPSKTTEELAKS